MAVKWQDYRATWSGFTLPFDTSLVDVDVWCVSEGEWKVRSTPLRFTRAFKADSLPAALSLVRERLQAILKELEA